METITNFGLERGTPIRMPSNSLLCISSSDRYDTIPDSRRKVKLTSPFDFTINKSQNIMAGSITRVALTEFSMPYNIPNINDNTNAIGIVLRISDGNEPPTYTYQAFQTGIYQDPLDPAGSSLDCNFYTGVQIGEYLMKSINQQIYDFNNAYNPDPTDDPQFTLNYLSSGNFAASWKGTAIIDFAFIPISTLLKAAGTKTTLINTKELYDLMAWYDVNPNLTPDASYSGLTFQKVQLSRISPLIPTKYIDVVCDQLTYNQELRDSASQPVVRDILARIYITTDSRPLITPLNYTFDSADVPYPYDTLTNPTTAQSTVFPTIAGTNPFTIYKDFATPKYIKWSGNQNIPGYIRFTLYDDQGNILSTHCNTAPQQNPEGPSTFYPDFAQPDWSMTLLASET
jgi:hypothetical protein